MARFVSALFATVDSSASSSAHNSARHFAEHASSVLVQTGLVKLPDGSNAKGSYIVKRFGAEPSKCSAHASGFCSSAGR